GQKYIELDFLPDEPARMVGLGRGYPELPTTPTAMEKLGDQAEAFFDKVADLPMDQMLEDLRKALQSLRQLLESPDLKGAVAGARRSREASPATIQEAREFIAEARARVKRLDGQVDGLSTDTRQTMEQAREAMDRARRSLERLDTTLAGADDTRLTAAQT